MQTFLKEGEKLIIWQKNVLIADRREHGQAMVWWSMKEDELADNTYDDIWLFREEVSREKVEDAVGNPTGACG